MQRQNRFRGLTSLVLPLALAGLTGVACNPKVRVPSDSEALEERDAGPVVPAEPEGAVPTASEPGRGEAPPDVEDLKPGSVVDDQSGVAVSCEIDAGMCAPLGDAGVGPACIPTGPRDCSSELDNDCDGQPDNVVDEVCVCALGTPEACEEHPGLDGNGPCRAGLRPCVLAADGLTSEWGACEGSVGPGETDSCTVRGDDIDCDGTPNTDCPCVDGDTQQCGSTTDTGPCAIGTSTCVDARFGPCVGATPPAAQDSCAPGDDSNCNGRANDRFCACLNGATQECGVTSTGVCELGTQTCINGAFGQCVGARDPGSRDCRSQQDNDCDGRPDNTIDAVCECIPGQGNGPCSEDPNNSRCNNQGRCAPCQTNADCSLVSGGRNSCAGGECVAPAPGPFDCDSPSPPAPSRPVRFVDPLGTGVTTGGVIVNGRYTMTELTFYGGSTVDFAEVIDLQDGSYRRNQVTYNATTDLVVSGFTEAGTYSTTPEGLLIIEGTTCSLGNSERSEVWEYSVTDDGLDIFKRTAATRRMESYQRSDF